MTRMRQNFRYIDPATIPPLAEYPTKRRFHINGIDVAWAISPWRRVYLEQDDSDDRLQTQTYSVSLYAGENHVARAVFEVYWFRKTTPAEHFVQLADEITQELYELAHGLQMAIRHLEDDEVYWAGSRFVEFKRLELVAGAAGKLLWPRPINGFISRVFKRTSRKWYDGLLLCPFPLEFEHTDPDPARDTALDHRRAAMARLYERHLGVELLPGASDAKWWMCRML